MMVPVLGGLLLLGAVACENTNGSSSDPNGGTTQEATESPDLSLGGEEVTVSGTVQEVVAGQVFTLTDATVEDGTAATDGELAVVATDGSVDVSASERVTVTGTLHEVDVADEAEQLEDLLGITLPREVLAQFEGREVLIASSVQAA
jgi:hypothetical protein